jgi:hypothetical protein
VQDFRNSNLVHAHLDNSPDFDINRHTDYAALAARLSLLDVAIGPGLTDVPYPRPPDPESLDASSTPSAPTRPTRPILTSEEIKFNKEVDALARHIKYVSNKIVEAGVLSDPSRSDAKSCAEKTYHRLENAVRIGGRKKKLIFGGDEEAGSRSVFGKFFTTVGSRSATPAIERVPQGTKDENMTS